VIIVQNKTEMLHELRNLRCAAYCRLIMAPTSRLKRAVCQHQWMAGCSSAHHVTHARFYQLGI